MKLKLSGLLIIIALLFFLFYYFGYSQIDNNPRMPERMPELVSEPVSEDEESFGVTPIDF